MTNYLDTIRNLSRDYGLETSEDGDRKGIVSLFSKELGEVYKLVINSDAKNGEKVVTMIEFKGNVEQLRNLQLEKDLFQLNEI